MKNEFLTAVPFLAGGTLSVGDANPTYILITTILTAIIEYIKWRRTKKAK